MSQITWRNVDAPDFSGALKGVEVANKLFNQALTSADAGIDKYRGMQTDAANRAIIGRMNAITDPLAYEEAMRQGQIVGPDSQNASIAMLQKAADQGGVLTERAANAEDLRSGLYKNKRNEGFDAADDAFSPNYAVITEQARKGNLDFLKEIPKLVGWDALSPERKDDIMRNFESSIASGQTFKLNLSREARAAADAARAKVLAARADKEWQRSEEAYKTREMYNEFATRIAAVSKNPEHWQIAFEDEIRARKLNPNQISYFANELAKRGVRTAYTDAMRPEEDLSLTGDPVADAAALATANEQAGVFQQTLNQLDIENSKLGSVGSIPIEDFQAYSQDASSLATVLNKAVAKGGDFEGANLGDLRTLAEDYKDKIGFGPGKVSPTAFFKIVKNNLKSTGTFETFFTDERNIGFGDNEIDPQTFDAAIAQAASIDPSDQYRKYTVSKQRKETLAAADVEAKKLYKQFKDSERLAKNNPAYRGQAEQDRVAYERAKARLVQLGQLADKSLGR